MYVLSSETPLFPCFAQLSHKTQLSSVLLQEAFPDNFPHCSICLCSLTLCTVSSVLACVSPSVFKQLKAGPCLNSVSQALSVWSMEVAGSALISALEP